MSDGPHRSLPMRKHWKDLAKRAETPAYPPADVAEAFPAALKKDFREAPLSEIRDILGGGKQSSLFEEDRTNQLEAARHACRGSVAGNILIDCAIEANADGLNGDRAFKTALENALYAYARGVCHQIEEHHQREEPRSAANFRERLNAARSQCSYTVLATEMMSDESAGSSEPSLRKRTGVDEGPPL